MPEGVWRVTGITDAEGVKAHNPRQRVQRHRRSGGWWRTLAGTRCDARAAVAHERGAGETAHGGAGAGVALVRNALAEAAVERAAELAESSALVPGVVRAAPLAARRMSATGSGQCTGPCAAGIAQGSRAAGGPHRKRPRRRAVSRTRRHGERRCRTAAMRGPVRPAGACRPPGFRPRSRARRRRASPIDRHPHRVFPLTSRRGPATLYGVGRVFFRSRLPTPRQGHRKLHAQCMRSLEFLGILRW